MPGRSIWSASQHAALFDPPTDEDVLRHHYTLSDDDIEHIRVRRGGHNRLGFALRVVRQGEIHGPSNAPAIPPGRARPARRHRHPLESVHLSEALRQQKHAGLTVEPEVLAASPALGGPTFCSPRIPVAEAPIAALAYDSAPLPESTRRRQKRRLRVRERGTTRRAWAVVPFTGNSGENRERQGLLIVVNPLAQSLSKGHLFVVRQAHHERT